MIAQENFLTTKYFQTTVLAIGEFAGDYIVWHHYSSIHPQTMEQMHMYCNTRVYHITYVWTCI